MKILICGGKGQLGSDCTRVLSRKYDVASMGSKELDITDPAAVHQAVEEIAPDLILNCAAFTKVDECETKKDLAWGVNAEGPKNLALISGSLGLRLIHISTDYVFDGRKKVPEPYTEADDPNPLSYYGMTKLEGEKAITEATDDYIILRTAWLYGIQGHNFLKTILKLALGDPKGTISVVNDQFGSPTWSYRLAQQIMKLIEIRGGGTYHASSDGYCTWYELATAFLEKIGISHSIIPCTTEEYPLPAVRPVNSILENQRLNHAKANVMGHWKDGLDQFVLKSKGRLLEEGRDQL
jgi:dTDP-4-dehydrorhamnose reductase